MIDNGKPVHGGNRERVTETAALRGATFSSDDFSIKTGDRQGLLALLLPGERNAIAARELAKITGRRPREITREIEALRLGGKPICASVKGYFAPKTRLNCRAMSNLLVDACVISRRQKRHLTTL